MSRTRGERQSAERAGRRAERWASLYLRAKGYQILAQRFKTRDGEIDIAAKRGRHMVFIEVKQRQTLDAALESIGYESEQRIMAAAEVFLTREPRKLPKDYALSFDVIYVIGRWKIVHKRDAFRGY